MGKRSAFKRIPRDRYDTPPPPVEPLLRHLKKSTRFIEPCAGKGALINTLAAEGHICVDAWDIKPRGESVIKVIQKQDARKHVPSSGDFDFFITNPPWKREILHPIIGHLMEIAPTWLLLDADWAHTLQAAPYMKFCSKIVSVGRVCWFPGTKQTGKDNCCWYLFDLTKRKPTRFYPRLAKEKTDAR